MKAKTYSYLADNNDGDKKAKDTKTCVIKQKLKFEDYQHCLETTQLENKIKQQEKKLDVNSLREYHREFMEKKQHKLILKSQQRFRSEKHDVFLKKLQD